jgi:DNA-binding response OmpR family regulator
MAENDKKTILIVEDEVMVRMLVVDVLNDLGFSALEAQDATTALPFLHGSHPIDLMITDIGLPGVDGWELARLARKARPDIKILILTGFQSADAATLERDGLQDVMVKPFDMGAFEAKVMAMLSPTMESGEV